MLDLFRKIFKWKTESRKHVWKLTTWVSQQFKDWYYSASQLATWNAWTLNAKIVYTGCYGSDFGTTNSFRWWHDHIITKQIKWNLYCMLYVLSRSNDYDNTSESFWNHENQQMSFDNFKNKTDFIWIMK